MIKEIALLLTSAVSCQSSSSSGLKTFYGPGDSEDGVNNN